MIDETTFLSDDDEGVKAVVAEHQAHRARRAEPMALLLTEVTNPSALEKLVRADIEKEREVLCRLLRQVDEFEAKPWGRPRVTLYFRRPRQREILLQTLSQLDDEQARCNARLAARTADARQGMTRRDPDPEEEPDALVRIWAARLRERLDAAGTTKQLRERTVQFIKNVNRITKR